MIKELVLLMEITLLVRCSRRMKYTGIAQKEKLKPNYKVNESFSHFNEVSLEAYNLELNLSTNK